MYKPLFNQRKALRFRQFTRKRWALFACVGRVVTIGVLSVATLRSAAVTATDTLSVAGGSAASNTDDGQTTDKEATLDDVEVTGSRAPLALGQAARMVTVLSRDEIQAAPVQSINDLLKIAVGVDVRQRGPIGAQTDVGIRGGTSEQITILLNGINICDPQTGHNAFDLPCDISDIERIDDVAKSLLALGHIRQLYGTQPGFETIDAYTQELNKYVHFTVYQVSSGIEAQGTLLTIKKGSHNEFQPGLALQFKGEKEPQSMYENLSEEDLANYNKVVENLNELLKECTTLVETFSAKIKTIASAFKI